jgi:hypothetical protein
MRVRAGLTAAGSVLLLLGIVTISVGHAMRATSPRAWQGLIDAGEIAAACGLGCGLALLIIITTGRSGRVSRPAARGAAAGEGGGGRTRCQQARGSAGAAGHTADTPGETVRASDPAVGK